MDNTEALRDALILYATTPRPKRDGAKAMCMAQASRMTEDEIIEATDHAQIKIEAWAAEVGWLGKELGDRK